MAKGELQSLAILPHPPEGLKDNCLIKRLRSPASGIKTENNTFGQGSTCFLIPLGWQAFWLRFEGDGYKQMQFKGEIKTLVSDFPGGPVVKNPPSSAGDVSLIPVRGTKIPHSTVTHVLQLRSDAAK